MMAETTHAGYSVIVIDPGRRTRVLATHAGLTVDDASELAAVYRSLDYLAVHILVPSSAREKAA